MDWRWGTAAGWLNTSVEIFQLVVIWELIVLVVDGVELFDVFALLLIRRRHSVDDAFPLTQLHVNFLVMGSLPSHLHDSLSFQVLLSVVITLVSEKNGVPTLLLAHLHIHFFSPRRRLPFSSPVT